MPSIKYPCYIEFSNTGRSAKIVHKNGRTVAELVIHGPFAARTLAIHTHACICGHASFDHSDPVAANPKCLSCGCTKYQEAVQEPFKCEVFGLANWERIVDEYIVDHLEETSK